MEVFSNLFSENKLENGINVQDMIFLLGANNRAKVNFTIASDFKTFDVFCLYRARRQKPVLNLQST
jgi:hypothetical protein